MLEAGPRLTNVPGVNVRNETDAAARARSSWPPKDQTSPPTRTTAPSTRRARAPTGSVGGLPGTPGPGRHAGRLRSRPTSGAWGRTGPAPARRRTAASASPSSRTPSGRTSRPRRRGCCTSRPRGSTRRPGRGPPWPAWPRPSTKAVRPAARYSRCRWRCTPRPGASPRWSGADTVLGPLAAGAHDHFELRPDTVVRRVLHSGGRATGVEIAGRDGARTQISAKVVVVAADALRTPQLLWASGIRPAALGRYLNDQPQVVAAVSVRTTGSGTSAGSAELNYGKEGLTSATCWPAWPGCRSPTACTRSTARSCSSTPRRSTWGSKTRPGVVVGLGWFCAKEIRAEDRLEFDDSELDSFGLPAIRIHYRLTDRDRAQIQAAMAQQRRAAEALGGFIPAASRACFPRARRCTTRAPSGWARPTTARRSATRPAPSGACPASTSAATASSRPPPPAIPPSPASRSPYGRRARSPSARHVTQRRNRHGPAG